MLVREAEVGGRGQWFSVVPGKRAEAGPGRACSPELLNTPVQKVPVGGRGMILGFREEGGTITRLAGSTPHLLFGSSTWLLA